MDTSAAEKIKEAERSAFEANDAEKKDIEKNLLLEQERCSKELEEFKAALAADSEKAMEKNLEEAKREIAGIRKKGEKTLKDVESLSKKNMGRAALAFVKIAGSWAPGD